MRYYVRWVGKPKATEAQRIELTAQTQMVLKSARERGVTDKEIRKVFHTSKRTPSSWWLSEKVGTGPGQGLVRPNTAGSVFYKYRLDLLRTWPQFEILEKPEIVCEQGRRKKKEVVHPAVAERPAGSTFQPEPEISSLARTRLATSLLISLGQLPLLITPMEFMMKLSPTTQEEMKAYIRKEWLDDSQHVGM